MLQTDGHMSNAFAAVYKTRIADEEMYGEDGELVADIRSLYLDLQDRPLSTGCISFYGSQRPEIEFAIMSNHVHRGSQMSAQGQNHREV